MATELPTIETDKEKEEKEMTRFTKWAAKLGYKKTNKDTKAELLWKVALLGFVIMAITFTLHAITSSAAPGLTPAMITAIWVNYLWEMGVSFSNVVLSKMVKYYNDELEKQKIA